MCLLCSTRSQYYQFVVLNRELGEPLVVFQSCNDGYEIPEKEEKTERRKYKKKDERGEKKLQEEDEMEK